MDNDKGSLISGISGWAVFTWVTYQHQGLAWAVAVAVIPVVALGALTFCYFLSAEARVKRHNRRAGFHVGQRLVYVSRFSTEEVVYLRPSALEDAHFVRIVRLSEGPDVGPEWLRRLGQERLAKTSELTPMSLPKLFA